MSETKANFESYLDSDERILWSGYPEPTEKSFRDKLKSCEGWIMGWVFAVALAFAAANAGLELIRSTETWQQSRFGVGLVLLVVALLIIYATVQMTLSSYRDQKTLAHERYAITGKRALCWSQFGKSFLVRSIPIMQGDWIGAELQVPGRILFSRAAIALSDEGNPLPDEDFVQFRDIRDADGAYRLIRMIQDGTV